MDDPVKQCLVSTFYLFAPLRRVAELRARIEALGRRYHILGTVLLADEGINATTCGEATAIMQWQEELVALEPAFDGLVFRHSETKDLPFRRWRVRVRPEIVTLGIDGLDPTAVTGQHVAPEDWNPLISRGDVRVIDTRNHYEYELGTFAGAEDPLTDTFRGFPEWVEAHLDPDKDQHVAMFCTGGIRCEKATAYLLQQGFRNVYQLHGGILRYLQQVPEAESLWQGECFIFDDRVALDHRLQSTGRQVCKGCRKPFREGDDEEQMVCGACLEMMDERQLAGVRERIRQVQLAEARGVSHLGPANASR